MLTELKLSMLIMFRTEAAAVHAPSREARLSYKCNEIAWQCTSDNMNVLESKYMTINAHDVNQDFRRRISVNVVSCHYFDMMLINGIMNIMKALPRDYSPH